LVDQIHDECGRFLGMCNLWQNFVGVSIDKFASSKNFCGYGRILWA